MSRHAAKAKAGRKEQRRDWPVVVYVWGIGLGFLSYLFMGEVVLAARPHPVHWLAGLVGGGLGVGIGWLWFRWRGDVI